MSHHSVAEASNQLSELIDLVLSGEGVVITRHGQPVVELKPVVATAKPVSSADLDWIAARRVGAQPAQTDPGCFVSRMRDEDAR